MLIVVQTLYLGFVLHHRKKILKRYRKLVVGNEFFLLALSYHCLAFADGSLDEYVKYLLGYSFLVVIGLLFAFNVATIVVQGIQDKVNKAKEREKSFYFDRFGDPEEIITLKNKRRIIRRKIIRK
jgi:formate-dependent nitrite reductase membrane component NrfD